MENNNHLLSKINNSALTSVSFPVLTSCQYMRLNGNTLPPAQINSILHQMLNITPATGKYINLSEQNPPAPPTGQGITDKETLINNGNTVETD